MILNIGKNMIAKKNVVILQAEIRKNV